MVCSKFYPGTGKHSEVGRGSGKGYTINVPWTAMGMGDADYVTAFEHLLVPIAKEFAPNLILVSAGFDAAAGDTVGR